MCTFKQIPIHSFFALTNAKTKLKMQIFFLKVENKMAAFTPSRDLGKYRPESLLEYLWVFHTAYRLFFHFVEIPLLLAFVETYADSGATSSTRST